jgi:hypothetical protein
MFSAFDDFSYDIEQHRRADVDTSNDVTYANFHSIQHDTSQKYQHCSIIGQVEKIWNGNTKRDGTPMTRFTLIDRSVTNKNHKPLKCDFTVFQNTDLPNDVVQTLQGINKGMVIKVINARVGQPFGNSEDSARFSLSFSNSYRNPTVIIPKADGVIPIDENELIVQQLNNKLSDFVYFKTLPQNSPSNSQYNVIGVILYIGEPEPCERAKYHYVTKIALIDNSKTIINLYWYCSKKSQPPSPSNNAHEPVLFFVVGDIIAVVGVLYSADPKHRRFSAFSDDNILNALVFAQLPSQSDKTLPEVAKQLREKKTSINSLPAKSTLVKILRTLVEWRARNYHPGQISSPSWELLSSPNIITTRKTEVIDVFSLCTIQCEDGTNQKIIFTTVRGYLDEIGMNNVMRFLCKEPGCMKPLKNIVTENYEIKTVCQNEHELPSGEQPQFESSIMLIIHDINCGEYYSSTNGSHVSEQFKALISVSGDVLLSMLLPSIEQQFRGSGCNPLLFIEGERKHLAFKPEFLYRPCVRIKVRTSIYDSKTSDSQTSRSRWHTALSIDVIQGK